MRPTLRDLPRQDRGIVGKLLVVSLLILALLAVAAFDAGSIVLARWRASELAEDASASAARVFERTGDEEAARVAALGTIAEADEEARVERIRIRERGVTVVLVARPNTLIAERIPFLEDLSRPTLTGTTTLERR